MLSTFSESYIETYSGRRRADRTACLHSSKGSEWQRPWRDERRERELARAPVGDEGEGKPALRGEASQGVGEVGSKGWVELARQESGLVQGPDEGRSYEEERERSLGFSFVF